MNKVQTCLRKSLTRLTLCLSLLFVFNQSLKAQTVLLDPQGAGGFELGSTMLSNGWQSANGSNDAWIVGSGTPPGTTHGVRAAYVSANGVDWSYSQENIFLHLYRDITIPVGHTIMDLSFSWKAGGEGSGSNDWDNMKVYIAPITVNPTTSSAVPALYQVWGNGATDGMYKSSPDEYQRSAIHYTVVPGQTYRLIFTWKSDVTEIANPPAALDSILVISRTPEAANGIPTDFHVTSVLSNSFQINWTDNSTNEQSFIVYRSFDNVQYTQVAVINSTTPTTTGTVYSYWQTGALAGETYYYRIVAMAETASGFLTGSYTTAGGSQTIYSTTTGGPWSNTNTWIGGVVPTSADNVVISDGATVIIDQLNLACKNLTVGEGTGTATLEFAGGTTNSSLTVYNNVMVSAQALFTANSGTGSKTLNIGGVNSASTGTGNLVVDGSFNMATSPTQFVTVIFRGVQNASISGSGPLCHFHTIHLQKGETSNNTSVLEVNRVITQDAPTTSANRLQLLAGTLKINSPVQLTPYYGSHTIINASSTLHLNHVDAKISSVGVGTNVGTGNITVAGTLRLEKGTFEYGSGSHRLNFNQPTSRLIVNEGVLNAFGTLHFLDNQSTLFEMTGGAINIDVQAASNATSNAFEVANGTTVNWTGGVITVVDPHAEANYNAFVMPFSTNKNITGGTLRLGDGVSGTPGATGAMGGFGISLGAGVYNLVIDNRVDLSPTRMVRLSTNSFTYQSVDIKANGYLFLGNGTTGNALVHTGPIFINNGTLAGTEPGGTQYIGTLQLSSSTQSQSISGNGVFINNQILTIGTAGVFTFSQVNQFNVERVNLMRGTVLNTNKLTIGLGGASSPVIQRGGISSFAAPAFNGAPQFNIGTGGLALVYANASGIAITGEEVPSNRSIASLAILNPANVQLNGGALQTIALVLNGNNNGLLNTSAANMLIVTGPISGADVGSYVRGPMRRAIPAPMSGDNTIVFPIGKSKYNPLQFITPVSSGPVSVETEVYDEATGGTAGTLLSSLSHNRYWRAEVLDGASNIVSIRLSLTDELGNNNAISGSNTKTGVYELVGGAQPTIDGNNIITAPPALTQIPPYLTLATLALPEITNVSITPDENLCVQTTRTIQATVVSNGASLGAVQVQYNINGVAQTPINMTNIGGNQWQASLPLITPSNGIVTWKIVAFDMNGLTKESALYTFQDEALLSADLQVTAQPSTVCLGQSTVLEVVVDGLSADYCVPTFVDSDANSGDYINNFSFANLTNNNSGDAPNDYTYYDQLTANVTAGGTYPISIQAGGTEALFEQQFRVWIDFNHDGVFDSTESVFASSLPSYSPTVITGNVTIPATAYNGITRMRVVSKYLTTPGANENCIINSPWGEVEDYNVLITGGQTGPLSPALYVWSDGTNTIGTTETVSVQPTQATDYTVTITFGNGCTKTSEPITITTQNIPPAPSLVQNSIQCGSGVPNVQVSGDNAGQYRWYLVPAGGAALENENNATLQSYSISSTTTFYVAIYDGSCESQRLEVVAEVTSSDEVNILASTLELCPNEPLELTAQQNGNNNNYTYTWTASPGEGSGISGTVNGDNIIIYPETSGTFTYTLIANDAIANCQASAQKSVVVKEGVNNIVVSAQPTQPCIGNTTQLFVTSDHGTAAPVNIEMDFEDSELPFTGWTFINNGQGNEWSLSNSAQSGTQALVYPFHATQAANAWAFSPSAYLKGGRTYLVSFWYKVQSQNFPEKLRLTVGNAATVAAQTTVLWSNNGAAVLTNEMYQQAIVTFTPTTTGVYHFGFHCFSDANMYYLWLDNIAITGDGEALPEYSWYSNPAGFTSSVQNPSNIIINTPATYYVEITNAFGCSGVGQLFIEPETIPESPKVISASHCGTQLSLASVSSNATNGAGIFNWYSAPTGGTPLQSGTSTQYLQPIGTTTTLYVSELSTAGCESERAAVTITVLPTDPVQITAISQTICLGGSAQLTALQLGNTQTYEYSWSSTTPGNGLVGTPTGNSISVTPLAVGSYIYKVEGYDATTLCKSVATLQINVQALPVITHTSAQPTTVCTGGDVVLTAGSEPSPIYAAIGDNMNTNTTTTFPAPFGSSWGNMRSQYLIRSSELSQAGLVSGYIERMTFDVTELGVPSTLNNFTIKIGSTAITAIAATIMDPSTTVFGPVNYTPNIGINTFEFDTPFRWDGDENIFVEICFNNNTVGSLNALTRMSPTGFTSSGFVGNDQILGSICDNPLLFASTNRPNMTFSGSTDIDPTPYYNYTWMPGGFAGTQVTVQPTQTATYTVEVYDPLSGCSSTGQVLVEVIQPLTMGNINGPLDASLHTTGQALAVYSVDIQNAEEIIWTIPAGATNVVGQGTSEISFNYPDGYQGGTISVTATSIAPCEETITRTLTVFGTCPGQPIVRGLDNVCNYVGTGETLTYYVENGLVNTNYEWILPPNMELVSGQGTDTIHVRILNGFDQQSNKQIRVFATSYCGTTPITIYYLKTHVPSAPGPVTGVTDICGLLGTNEVVTYSITEVLYANLYEWVVPQGVTIVNGQGTNTLQVIFDDDFVSSKIDVYAWNDCGRSTVRSLRIYRNIPSRPGLIEGPQSICTLLAVDGGGPVYGQYRVNGLPEHIYTWSVPAGVTIVSGQGTAEIQVSYDGSFVGGEVSVFATNTCGVGVPRTLALNYFKPGTPADIQVEVLADCSSRVVRYSIDQMPRNSTAVEWTVPAGAVMVSGQGTLTIVVDYGSSVVNGEVTVKGRNGCGDGNVRKKSVKYTACPGTQPDLITYAVKELKVKKDMEVLIYPNPNSGQFFIAMKDNPDRKVSIRIYDQSGRIVKEQNVYNKDILPMTTRLASGIYWVETISGGQRITQKVHIK